ncbi:hypothetical protein MASR2M69_00340 [Bacteroidota bacterium]
MTASELKIEAKKKKDADDYSGALELYKQLWELEKNEWNGYFLAQCYRKTDDFESARELHSQLENIYPNFNPLQNEKLWLDYSEKIKSWKNPNLVEDGESILERADKYDKYTGSLYVKTVLNVVKYLCYKTDYSLAYNWLCKLDQSVISNSVYNFQGRIFPADRKVYFIRFADVLINLNEHESYIEQCFTSLNFTDSKQRKFKKHVIEEITFDDYISRLRLARFIKNFQEEFYLRNKKTPVKVYNSGKTTLISDLSHYLFCPISFAINESYLVDANTTWEKDEWLNEKKHLGDRFLIFNKNKSYKETFKDCEIPVNEKLESDFGYIFNSKLIINNINSDEPTVFTNRKKDLIGAPDYLFSDTEGLKYAVTEKFSHINSSDSKVPFESDLIKHFAYLNELDENISFGYFITWYWELIDIETNSGNVKKKIVITSYRITKIEKTALTQERLQTTINKVNEFKLNKYVPVDADRISFAEKCLNCSFFTYCNHKTGKFDEVKLPYDLEINKIGDEPIINNEINEDGNQINEDNLPF